MVVKISPTGQNLADAPSLEPKDVATGLRQDPSISAGQLEASVKKIEAETLAVLESKDKEILRGLLSNMSPEDRKEIVQNLAQIARAVDGRETTTGLSGEQARDYLKSLIHEADNFSEIAQGRFAGCMVVSRLARLAIEDPEQFKADYLKWGSALATKGKTTLPDGSTMVLQDSRFGEAFFDRASKDDGKNFGYRAASLSTRAITAAFMELANGADAYYDVTSDTTNGLVVKGVEIEPYSGLFAHQGTRLDRALGFEQNKSLVTGTTLDLYWGQGAHVIHHLTYLGTNDKGEVLLWNPQGDALSAVAMKGNVPPGTRALGDKETADILDDNAILRGIGIDSFHGVVAIKKEDFDARLVRDPSIAISSADTDPSVFDTPECTTMALAPTGFDYVQLLVTNEEWKRMEQNRKKRQMDGEKTRWRQQ